MSNERRPPGFVPGYMKEDLQMREVSGPPKYTSRTDKGVVHISVADAHDHVIGYLYANDEDDAAGWVQRAAAPPTAGNLVVAFIDWLLDAKKRGIAPTAALDEMLTQPAPSPAAKIVAGSRHHAVNLDALKALAGVAPIATGTPRRGG